MSLALLTSTGIELPEGVPDTTGHVLGLPVADDVVASTDPFDDFDDDDFDDDFEEEWDDDLPGDADQFEPDEEDENAPFSDDPEFDEE